MSIGNAINSLPIAYAPLSGTGRKVAYALASPSIDTSLSSVGTFIVDPAITLAVGVTDGFTALRYANAGVSLSAEAGMGGLPFRITGVMAELQAVTAASGVPYAVQSAASALAESLGALTAVVSRVRFGASSFKSLYTPPGARASGNAINSFSLNSSAINAKAGQVWRTFVTTFSPSGKVVFDPSLTLQAEAETQAQGNTLLVGDISAAVTTSLGSIANAVFDPNPTLAIQARISPFAMAYRKTGGTFIQDVSVLSGVGQIIAGGGLSVSCSGGISPLGSVIGSGGAAVSATGALAAIGSFLAYGAVSIDDILATLSSTASRARVADVLMPALSTFGGPAWEQKTVVISPVYASGWDGDQGLDIIGTIVYQVVPENIVYQVAPESIVYGQIDE